MRLYKIALALCVAALIALAGALYQTRQELNQARYEAWQGNATASTLSELLSAERNRADAAEESLRQSRLSARRIADIAQDAQQELAGHLSGERRLIAPLRFSLSLSQKDQTRSREGQ